MTDRLLRPLTADQLAALERHHRFCPDDEIHSCEVWPLLDHIKLLQTALADMAIDAADQDRLLVENKKLRSWPGLMETVNRLYPSDVIDGSSGDPGPTIVTLLRQIEQLRRRAWRRR
ncbi:MAG TPA: hypothetical protein VIV12_06320 [Streptosporangiaceae bacterium]